MKKLAFISVMILFSGFAFSQTLQKGVVIGFHNGTFVPNPDVTMNQCTNFLKEKYIPMSEQCFPGMKTYLLKGVRGECVDCFAFISVFQSDEVRNKYWKEAGVFTELGNAAEKKLQPVIDEMGKYGKMTDKYTDWVIQ
jgi:hypothetical protein